jgi:hypothetical protein
MRGTYDYGIHIAAVQHFRMIVVLRGPIQPEFLLKQLSAPFTRIRKRNDLHSLYPRQSQYMTVGDIAAADKTDTNGAHPRSSQIVLSMMMPIIRSRFGTDNAI